METKQNKGDKMKLKKIGSLEILESLLNHEEFFKEMIEELNKKFKSKVALELSVYKLLTKMMIRTTFNIWKLRKGPMAKEKLSAGRYKFSLKIRDRDGKELEVNGGNILIPKPVKRFKLQKRILEICKIDALENLGVREVFDEKLDVETELINSIKFTLVSKLLADVALNGKFELEMVSHFH